MKKRIIAAMLISSMALGLCACEGGKEKEKTEAEVIKEEATSEESEDEETVSEIISTSTMSESTEEQIAEPTVDGTAVEEEVEEHSIDLGGKTLIDNEYFTLVANCFFEEEYVNDGIHKNVEFSVTNNREEGYIMLVYEFFIGDESVSYQCTQTTDTPVYGKKYPVSVYLYRESGSKEIQLESLEELYDLNGVIHVHVFDENKTQTSVEQFAFDLSSVKQ